MKIKEGMLLHKVGEEYYAVALGGKAEKFDGMIKLNETGVYIWRLLEKGITKEEIVKNICNDYENIDAVTVMKDVEDFLKTIEPVLERHNTECSDSKSHDLESHDFRSSDSKSHDFGSSDSKSPFSKSFDFGSSDSDKSGSEETKFKNI